MSFSSQVIATQGSLISKMSQGCHKSTNSQNSYLGKLFRYNSE